MTTINHPKHYNAGSFETIDVIDDVAKHAGYTSEEMFYIGNVLKYVMRAPNKNEVEDLEKAYWYLGRLIANKQPVTETEQITFSRHQQDAHLNRRDVSNLSDVAEILGETIDDLKTIEYGVDDRTGKKAFIVLCKKKPVGWLYK